MRKQLRYWGDGRMYDWRVTVLSNFVVLIMTVACVLVGAIICRFLYQVLKAGF